MFHLIFTPHDLSGYTFEWLERYDKYIVAKEIGKKKKHLHYHILIVTDAKHDTVRDMAKSRLHIPPGQRGKESKYYALLSDWKDPGYICKSNDVQAYKGYSEKEIMDFVISGKKKYLEEVDETPAENSVTAAKSPITAKSPRIPYQQQIIAIADAEWYKIKREYKEKNQFTMSVSEAKGIIVDLVCKAMREVSRGINPYLLQDCVYAIFYDDVDYKDIVLEKLKSRIQL